MTQESSDMDKDRIHSFKSYLTIAAILCVFFVIGSAVFVFFMMQKSNEQNLDYLENDAKKKEMTLNKQVEGDIQLLEGIATIIGQGGDVNFKKTLPILDEINRKNTFIRMGIADLDGNLTLVDMQGKTYDQFNLRDNSFFKKAAQGQAAVSGAIKDSLDLRGYINYYCVPIKNKNQQIDSILCAVNSTQMYRQIIDTPIFNNQGFTSLIDSDGDFVVRSLDAMVSQIGPSGVWDLNLENEKSIKKALKEEGKSLFEFEQNGEQQIGLIKSIGINDWSIFSVISKEVLTQQYKMTAIGVSVIIILALIIFIVILSQQRRLNREHERELETLAYTDSLTGAPNRTKFLLDASAYLQGKKGEKCAIWYCDLKKFKYFNDVFGHQKGDEVLKELAAMLGQESQQLENPIFCRESADNFTGIRVYEDRHELAQWFQTISHQLTESGGRTENRTGITLCMGFCCVENDEEVLSINELIDRANMAQKSVKDQPGAQYAYFTEKIREGILLEEVMADSGKYALTAGQFVPYAQPKINIQNGNRVAGMEILTRWLHPEKGLVSPGLFIPIFEKNGMIVELDRYIFEKACKWLRQYLDSGRPPINMAVNVSKLGLMQEDFVAYYVRIKQKYKIPDNLLELEFTESMIWQDRSLFLKTVEQLHHGGFICSLDDFGAGYSSLNLLKNLPVDVLKLDIMFFRETVNVEREHIVITHIINMAKELQMKIIAEGVETEQTVEFLKTAGCNVIQGYYFSKPIALDEFDQKLAKLGGSLRWQA